MAVAERRGRPHRSPRAARSAPPARLVRSAGRHDKRMRDHAVPATTVTEQTATLLWESCRRDPDPASLRRALAGGADIGWAVSAASEQRIGPLLWRALGAAGSLDALGPDGAALGGVADASRMEALLLLPRAVALAVRPLTDAGLEPVVFKGPAVAARYPEPGLRPMDDIDLLLPQADHRRALDALGHAGWQVARPGGRDTNATVLTHREVPSFFLEVHYALEGASQRVTALDPGTLWAMRQPLECAGTSAFGLPPAEELVVLAAHAGGPHHRFVRLVWMADLAMIVGAAATHGVPIDWERVRARGRGRTVRDGGGRRPGDGPPGRPGRAGRPVPSAHPGSTGRRSEPAALGHLAADKSRTARLAVQVHADRRPDPARQDLPDPLRPRSRDPGPGTPGGRAAAPRGPELAPPGVGLRPGARGRGRPRAGCRAQRVTGEGRRMFRVEPAVDEPEKASAATAPVLLVGTHLTSGHMQRDLLPQRPDESFFGKLRRMAPNLVAVQRILAQLVDRTRHGRDVQVLKEVAGRAL